MTDYDVVVIGAGAAGLSAGALVMWNITAFGDPALARFSFGAMKELRTELAG